MNEVIAISHLSKHSGDGKAVQDLRQIRQHRQQSENRLLPVAFCLATARRLDLLLAASGFGMLCLDY